MEALVAPAQCDKTSLSLYLTLYGLQVDPEPSLYLHISLHPYFLQHNTQKTLPYMSTVTADLMSGLPFVNSSVARIDCEELQSSCHYTQAAILLRECRRVLKPNSEIEIVSQEDNSSDPLLDTQELVDLAEIVGLTMTDCPRRFIKYRPPQNPTPLVSILMTTYKAMFFKPCLESALNQTYKNCEIIICDDCPTEAIRTIVTPYLERDARIKYFKNPTRLHLRENFKKCFSLAQGDYIKFLNDDDILHAECIERMLSCLQQFPDVTLVTSRRLLIDEKDDYSHDAEFNRPLAINDSLIEGCHLTAAVLFKGKNYIGEPTTVMFRRCDLINAQPDMMSFAGRLGKKGVRDINSWLNLLSKGDAIYLAEPLSYFRIHPDQLTNDPDIFLDVENALLEFIHDAKRIGLMSNSYDDNQLIIQPIKIKPWWSDKVKSLALQLDEKINAEFIDSNALSIITQMLDQALLLLPKDVTFLIITGRLLLKLGDFNRAKQFFLRVFNQATVPSLSSIYLAYTYFLLGDAKSADLHFTAAARAMPFFVEGFYNSFHSMKDSVNWLGSRAVISIPKELLELPIAVNFELACQEPEYYSQFPFDVELYVDESLSKTFTFSCGRQTEPVTILLNPSNHDINIKLICESSIPAEKFFRRLKGRRFSVALHSFFINIRR
jgi:glycosyltransferase involved in cell wall biosynthesis